MRLLEYATTAMVTMPSRTPILEKANGTGSTELQVHSIGLVMIYQALGPLDTKILASLSLAEVLSSWVFYIQDSGRERAWISVKSSG